MNFQGKTAIVTGAGQRHDDNTKLRQRLKDGRNMKLKKWLTLFFAAVTIVAGAAENAVRPFKVDFNDPTVKAAVAKCPYARIEKDFEQTDILTIEVPKGAANLKEQNFVRLPIDFEKMELAVIRFSGKLIFVIVMFPSRHTFGWALNSCCR